MYIMCTYIRQLYLFVMPVSIKHDIVAPWCVKFIYMYMSESSLQEPLAVTGLADLPSLALLVSVPVLRFQVLSHAYICCSAVVELYLLLNHVAEGLSVGERAALVAGSSHMSHCGVQEDIHVDDFITSYLLKTCLMKLLPRHSPAEGCNNCNEWRIRPGKQTTGCRWSTVERDSACRWAIRIYGKLKKELMAKKIFSWHTSSRETLMNCQECEVEHGCCKKRKLTLAITSRVLDWLKKHQGALFEAIFV